MKRIAITTKDNPYNPITQFDEWYNYDVNAMRYCTCEYLARLTNTSDELTDEENYRDIERAIDEIVMYNPELYVKVTG